MLSYNGTVKIKIYKQGNIINGVKEIYQKNNNINYILKMKLKI